VKKVMITAVAAILLLVGFAVSVPAVNNLSAERVEAQLAKIPLPADTERIESLSRAGKLVGNGNGMQYFGALLIRSDRTLEELSDYYAGKLAGTVVREQKTQRIECAEHVSLSFRTPVPDTGDYYIVYRFGSGIPLFAQLDLRGH